MASWLHLARRFFGSLSPRRPPSQDVSWAQGAMIDGELALWQRMSAADQRHAVGVARATVAALGADAARPVVAAALFHDVGKVQSGFGPWRRAGATLAGEALGYQRCRAWAGRRGVRGRVGDYLSHDEIGAALLRTAGSHELTVSWARQHHLPAQSWTVPRPLGEALKAADDD